MARSVAKRKVQTCKIIPDVVIEAVEGTEMVHRYVAEDQDFVVEQLREVIVLVVAREDLDQD